jgi:hypothetical protein
VGALITVTRDVPRDRERTALRLDKVFPFDEAHAAYRYMFGRAFWQNRHPRNV